MNEVDEKEQKLIVKRFIRQFMNTQLSELKGEKQDSDNSFVFLEKDTLNILMTYLLLNASNSEKEEVYEDTYEEIIEEFEQIIAKSKKDFEEIIHVLKEKIE